jgi:threonine synthase
LDCNCIAFAECQTDHCLPGRKRKGKNSHEEKIGEQKERKKAQMKFFSTRNNSDKIGFGKAALTGLAPDGGLYIPEAIPQFSSSVIQSLGTMDFRDVAIETIRPYVKDDIPNSVLEDLVVSAYPFSAPLISVGDRMMLELFHGPTAAFKDFGARFMARAFSYLRRGEDKPLHILVATSGDTGGAVADGFFNIEGIDVTVLYPKGRVTPLQEKQIAGLGGNISAIEVEGSFDDCQALVKAAFADEELKRKLELSSANSINISRLIPQAVYYAASAGIAFAGRTNADGAATPRNDFGKTHIPQDRRFAAAAGKPITFCVPSGNFGNLTAGLYAMKMGAPIKGFIAATNINKTIPDYLENGIYEARQSQATLSNAMDVGAPSNFERMKTQWSYEELRQMIRGAFVTDDETRSCIDSVYKQYGYYLDPHGAVAWNTVDQLREKDSSLEEPLAVLGTAHPAKFSESVQPITGEIPLHPALKDVMQRTVLSKTISMNLEELKAELI